MARSIKVEIIGDASSLSRAFGQASGSAAGFGSKMATVGKAAGVAALAIGGVLVAGAIVAAKKFAEFEAALNTFQAVSSATAKQMEAVSDRAKELGNDLTLPGTSAKDAALAMTELAKGGLSVGEAMDAAKASIQLATAAEVDGAHAAEIMSDALNTFNLTGKDAAHVADLLANGANATSASIDDMAMALKMVGNVAHQVGLSIDTTTVALGLMADAGLKGSDAGTSLKTMLLNLAAPTDRAAALMAELGFKTMDLHGELLPMPALIDNWRAATEGMSSAQELAAMKVIFGTDAVRAAGAILGSEKGKWDDMAAAMGRQGSAAEVAAAKSKGLKGAWDGLKSSLETAAITIGAKIAPALETVIRKVAEFVNKLSNAKSAGDAFNIILDAIGSVLSKIGSKLMDAVGAVNWNAVGQKMFSLLAAAIPPAFSGLAKVFAGLFTGIGEAIGEALNTQIVNALQSVTAGVASALAGVVSSIADVAEAFDTLDAALPGHPMGEFADKLRDVEDALHGVEKRAHDFKTADEKLNEEIDKGNEIIQTQAQATQHWADRLHGLQGTVKVTGSDLDKMAAAVVGTTGQMKIADAAALVLAAHYGRVPTKIETKALLHDPEARAKLEAWVAKINGTPATVKTKAEMAAEGAIKEANNLHGRINAIPKTHHTKATADGGQAIGTARAVRNEVNSVPTSHHTTFTASWTGRPPELGFAGGGIVPRTGMYMVGEKGPELLQLPGGSEVFTAGDTADIINQLGTVGVSTYPFAPPPGAAGMPSGYPFAPPPGGAAAESSLLWWNAAMAAQTAAGAAVDAAQAATENAASSDGAPPPVNIIIRVEGPVTSRRDFAQEIRDALSEFSMYTPSLWAGRA